MDCRRRNASRKGTQAGYPTLRRSKGNCGFLPVGLCWAAAIIAGGVWFFAQNNQKPNESNATPVAARHPGKEHCGPAI